VPRSHEVRRNLNSLISVDVGIDLLEPGRMIDDFPNLKVFFDNKEGNWLNDLLVFDFSQKGVTREIRAEKALVSTNGTDIVLDMYKVRVDPVEADAQAWAVADRFQHVIPNALKRRSIVRKEKDFRFDELRRAIGKLRANPDGCPRHAAEADEHLSDRVPAPAGVRVRLRLLRPDRRSPRHPLPPQGVDHRNGDQLGRGHVVLPVRDPDSLAGPVRLDASLCVALAAGRALRRARGGVDPQNL
jgi:hypothetical protein